MKNSPLLELQEATVFRSGRRVLDRLNLRIETGEHTAILGPNGCGKSTFIQVLTRQVLPVWAAGAPPPVRVLGQPRWNLTHLRKQLGIVSADAHAKLVQGNACGAIKAWEAVCSGFYAAHGLFINHSITPEMRLATEAALDRMGIGALSERWMDELSTGEARRVLIARALIHQPQALILDEPTTGLDVVAAQRFLQTIRQIAQSGTTVILVTHHPEELIPELRRVILLQKGRIAADGAPEDVLTDARISAAYAAPMHVFRTAQGYRMEVRATEFGHTDAGCVSSAS